MGYSGQEATVEAKRMMSEVDEDNDGEISFSEFAAVWQRKILSVNDDYIKAVFNVLDRNSDGFVDAEELSDVLDGVSKDDVQKMIAEVDTRGGKDGKGDGKIDFQEFKLAMKEQIKHNKVKPMS